MKFLDDKHRNEKGLAIGDVVYLKLQAYKQKSVEVRRQLKLSAKYYGPFPVIAKIGQVAYKLQFLIGFRIHPVFHVSQLKKKVGDSNTLMPTLPQTGPDDQILIRPEAVLKRQLIWMNQQLVSYHMD